MFETMMLIAITTSLFGNLYLATKDRKLKNVLQAAVDKAERDRTEYVRIPFNQMRDLGFDTRHGYFRANDFNAKPGPHPARLSPARRKKL